jgi:hypothetical protein
MFHHLPQLPVNMVSRVSRLALVPNHPPEVRQRQRHICSFARCMFFPRVDAISIHGRNNTAPVSSADFGLFFRTTLRSVRPNEHVITYVDTEKLTVFNKFTGIALGSAAWLLSVSTWPARRHASASLRGASALGPTGGQWTQADQASMRWACLLGSRPLALLLPPAVYRMVWHRHGS